MDRGEIDGRESSDAELAAEIWRLRRFGGLRSAFRPEVDLYRTEDPPELTVVVELAGVDPNAVEIVATPRRLVIKGERVRPHAAGRVYEGMEIAYGPFGREIRLGASIDPAGVRATYTDGLLTIVLPVAAAPRRRVEVEVEGRSR